MRTLTQLLSVIVFLVNLSPISAQSLSYSELMNGSPGSSPVDESAFARPLQAQPAKHQFEGRLTLEAAAAKMSDKQWDQVGFLSDFGHSSSARLPN